MWTRRGGRVASVGGPPSSLAGGATRPGRPDPPRPEVRPEAWTSEGRRNRVKGIEGSEERRNTESESEPGKQRGSPSGRRDGGGWRSVRNPTGPPRPLRRGPPPYSRASPSGPLPHGASRSDPGSSRSRSSAPRRVDPRPRTPEERDRSPGGSEREGRWTVCGPERRGLPDPKFIVSDNREA